MRKNSSCSHNKGKSKNGKPSTTKKQGQATTAPKWILKTRSAPLLVGEGFSAEFELNYLGNSPLTQFLNIRWTPHKPPPAQLTRLCKPASFQDALFAFWVSQGDARG